MDKKPEIFIVQPSSASTICNKASVGEKIGNKKYSSILNLGRGNYFNKNGRISHSQRLKMSDDDLKIKCVDGLYGLLALVILTSASLSPTMLPVHNVISNPEYWYEIIFSSFSTAFFLSNCGTIAAETVGVPFKKSRPLVILDMFVTFKIAELFVVGVIHLIWSHVLGYFEPFPNRWLVIYFPSALVAMVRRWRLVPLQTRMDSEFRRRYKFYVGWGFGNMFMSIQLNLILQVLKTVQLDSQWMIALMLPLTKIINDYVQNKLITKAALIDNLLEAKYMTSITNNLTYSIAFAIAFTNISKSSEFLLLGINACINVFLCCKAIRLDKKVSTLHTEEVQRKSLKEHLLTELILNETIEMTVPLAFIGSFLMGYFGPNMEMLGNVGCAIWKFEKTDGLYSLIGVIEMAFFDFGSVILTGGLLWTFCRINIAKEYLKTIKKYWIHVASHGGTILSAVSTSKSYSKNTCIKN